MNYFIYGSEHYLLRQELNKIIAGTDNSEISTVYYDGQSMDFDLDRVLEDASMISLFDAQKIIVVNDPAFLSGTVSLSDYQVSSLRDYLRNSSHFTTLIFCYGMDNKIDQRRKIYKLLTTECRVINIPPLKEEEFHHYVINDLKQVGIEIDKAGMQELLARLPLDIVNWKSELVKLKLYGAPLDEEAIRHLISRSLDDNVFLMVNAVVRRDLKKAMSAWQDLAVMKHDPIELIAILAAQFRFMYQCLILSRRYDNKRIAELTNAKPGRVNITLANSRYTTPERVLRLLSILAELDQKIKSGIINKQLGFELFLIEATR